MLVIIFQEYYAVLFGSKVINPATPFNTLALQVSASELLESNQNVEVNPILCLINNWSFIIDIVCVM